MLLSEDKKASMSLLEHFSEFRKRFIKACFGVAIGLAIGWAFYNPVINLLVRPFCNPKKLVGASHCGVLYINGVLGPINLHLTVAFLLGIFISSPIWIYQLWAFVSPGLHKKEKRYSVGFLFAAIPFFAAGALLGYLLISPAVKFLLDFTPGSLTNLIRFDEYLNFVLRIILIFALAFELPVFLIALNLTGVVRGRSMLKPWRYVVFGITVFCGIFVPTGDPLSMILLAIPMIMFYFLAAVIGILVDRKRDKKINQMSDVQY